jgi:hypothetical protein
MSLVLMLLIVVALIVLAGAMIAWRRHRTPAPLRGNWWANFERDLQVYATLHRPVRRRHDRG